jgi:hypothetical protein
MWDVCTRVPISSVVGYHVHVHKVSAPRHETVQGQLGMLVLPIKVPALESIDNLGQA